MSRVIVNNTPRSNGTGIMKQTLKLSVLLGCVLAAGCAARHHQDPATTSSIKQDYRKTHPIVVGNDEETADLYLTPQMTGISERHRNTITHMVGLFKRSGAANIHILVPTGSKNASAARHVSREAVALMKTLYVDAGKIRVERYQAANHGDSATVRLVFSSLGARVENECGQWPEDLNEGELNQNYDNYGCATQNNLAAMIANPADLLGPRGESEIDAGRRDSVVNDWRTNGSQ